MSKLKIDNIITQIAPDQPYFIKTEDEYKISWEKFIKGKFDYQFVLNPNPVTLKDVILDMNRLKFLMDGSFLKSSNEFEMGSAFFYSKRHLTLKYEVDCFLTPLLYAYNNSQKNIPIIVNDFPVILFREFVVRNIKLDELKNIYNTYVIETKKGNYNFDPALMKSDILISPKIEYMTEVIKQSCFIGKKNIVIVDMNCAEFVAEVWPKIAENPDPNNLKILLCKRSKYEFF